MTEIEKKVQLIADRTKHLVIFSKCKDNSSTGLYNGHEKVWLDKKCFNTPGGE